MALGGGSFVTQDKILPGSYLNFISASRANTTLSDRGIVAVPMVASWGAEEKVIKLEKEDFESQSKKLFGYDWTHEKVRNIRELFLHAKSILCYRLNQETVKASNSFCTAHYGGIRGNDLKIVISKNVDDPTKYDVKTLFEDVKVDLQTVTTTSELFSNEYVDWKTDFTLEETASNPLTGGEDGTNKTGEAYDLFLKQIEHHSFHVLCCNTDDQTVIKLFLAFTKRMRDEVGAKFQTVVYRAENADYEGIISVENQVLTTTANPYSLVYWVSGIAAGCAVNQSNTNQVYNGEYEMDVNFTQTQLKAGLKNGKFMLHQVGDQVRILRDINTFVSYTKDKNEDFSSNQTIRVLDQIGNDVAVLFQTKYLGNVPNDESGRISLWNDLVSYYKKLEQIRAIETINVADIKVEKGENKQSVVVVTPVTPINAMEQLYMTCIIQ